jgi:hypothetical protein
MVNVVLLLFNTKLVPLHILYNTERLDDRIRQNLCQTYNQMRIREKYLFFLTYMRL